MSEWSIALETQAALAHFCSRFTSFDDMRKRAWVHKNLDGEMAAHDPEMFGDEHQGAKAHDLGFWLLSQPIGAIPPYYFSVDTSKMLQEVSPSFPLTSSYPDESRFLSVAGFWYFAHPIGTMLKLDVEERPIRALLWMRTPDGLTFAACLDGDRALIPAFFTVWPKGQTIEQTLRDSRALLEHGRYPPDELEWFMELGKRLQQFMGAALTFCHQRIFLDARQPADRATRRRVQAAMNTIEPPSDIHVITLRRPVGKESAESRDVDWQWRWWVRGHWRQQAVGPNHQDRAPVWIMAHVKGPEDRPMKPSVPTIYNVTR
jgi:hypothetical protein